MTPTAAAVICCYTPRRWDALLEAIDSVLEQRVPLDVVVVVDHADDLLARLVDARPDVRVVPSSGTPGLSGARNTGVDLSKGEVVLFLDDDAVAAPGWAEALLDCFADETVMAAGGRVEPDWETGQAPRWFPAEFGWVVGCSYTGQPTGLAPVRNPIGASMAVRRSVFEAVGGFDSGLGRVGTLPAGCEETELCLRLARHDPKYVVLLQPGSVVRHKVPLDRQRFGYLVSRCYHEGRSKAAVARLSRKLDQQALGTEAAYARNVLPAALVRHARAALQGSRADAVAAAAVFLGLGAAVLGFALQSVQQSLPGREWR